MVLMNIIGIIFAIVFGMYSLYIWGINTDNAYHKKQKDAYLECMKKINNTSWCYDNFIK